MKQTGWIRLGLILGGLFVFSACSSFSEEVAVVWREEPAQLNAEYGSLFVPEVIPVGVTVYATVTSFGSSSCTRIGPVDVRAEGFAVTLHAFDSFPALSNGEPVACTADYAAHPRPAAMTFAGPGSYTVSLIGANDTIRQSVEVR